MKCKKFNSEEIKNILLLDELNPMEAGEIQGGVEKCKCKCKCDGAEEEDLFDSE